MSKGRKFILMRKRTEVLPPERASADDDTVISSFLFLDGKNMCECNVTNVNP